MKFLFTIFVLFYFSILNAQIGSLDSSFALNGVQTLSFSKVLRAEPAAAFIQKNDKIFVIADIKDTINKDFYSFGFLRFTANGELDNTFKNNDFSVVEKDINLGLVWNDRFSVQKDEKILIGGAKEKNIDTSFATIGRFLENGERDKNFGDNGRVIWDSFEGGFIYKPMELSNGDIIGVGTAIDSLFTINMVIAKCDKNGKKYNSFGLNGIKTVNFIPNSIVVSIYEPTLIKNDKILAYVEILNEELDSFQLYLVQLKSDGELDKSFGNGLGYVPIKLLGNIEVQKDGKILIIGQKEYLVTGDKSSITILRLLPNGLEDINFSAKTHQLTYEKPKIANTILQDDGKLLLSLIYSKNNRNLSCVLRFDTDGQFDKTFGTLGHSSPSKANLQFLPNLTSIGMFLDKSNRIITINSMFSNSNGYVITRYKNDVITNNVELSSPEASVNLYPNPSSKWINVEIRDKEITSIRKINFIDESGRLILTQYCKELTQIDCSNWKNGVYIFQILDDNQILKSGYFLKI